MASLTRGGPEIGHEKHPTAERLWREERRSVCDRCGQSLDWVPEEVFSPDEIERVHDNPAVWYVCESCLHAMPDPPPGLFWTRDDGAGNVDAGTIVPADDV